MLKLDPHQEIGRDFMAGNDSALIFDEAGSGKTAQAIAALDKAQLRKNLIVVPAQVKSHWRREFQRFSKFERTIEVIEGYVKKPVEADTVVVSHAAIAHKKSTDYLKTIKWDSITIDESHEFRNWTAKRTQNMFGPEGVWLNAGAIWPMSGTPVVNSAADLYPIVQSSIGRRTGWTPTWWDFCSRFTVMRPDFKGNMAPFESKNETELQGILKPFWLRRTGLLDIPLRIGTMPIHVEEKHLAEIVADLTGYTPQQFRDYLEADFNVEEHPISRVRHALGLVKAKTAAEYILYLLGVLNARPIVAFFIHRKVREEVVRILTEAKYRVAWIDGTTSGNHDHTRRVQDEYSEGKIDVVMVQTQAGGVGLTFTRGNRVVVIESPWTAVGLEQEIKRVHRKTQTRAVIVDVLYAEGCWLEEIIADVIARKAQMAIRVLDTKHTGVAA